MVIIYKLAFNNQIDLATSIMNIYKTLCNQTCKTFVRITDYISLQNHKHYINVLFIAIWLLMTLILSKSLSGHMLNIYSSVKFKPMFQTLDDIRNDTTINLVGGGVLLYKLDKDNLNERLNLSGQYYNEYTSEPITWVNIVLNDFISGKVAFIYDTIAYRKVIWLLTRSIDNGIHYKLLDNKYYPIYGNNYITNDNEHADKVYKL